MPTPVVPVFQAVLPNGKVLMWDSVGDGPAGVDDGPDVHPGHGLGPQARTRPAQVTCPGYNIFCAGYTQLADGRVLVAGGNKNPALDGIVQTHLSTGARRPGPGP